jgi:hypothetical protein
VSRRPDLFIIGAAKCGTTSLYEYLRGHPEVYMSPAKEPRYFSPDLLSRSAHDLHYGKDLQRYLALFKEARDEKRLGEASVRYIYSQEAPRLIREFQPWPYIVAMLRNPIDMVYSMHNQRVSEGREEFADFEQALAAEQDRLVGRTVAAGVNPALTVYRPRARFGEQLPRWFETFGRERVHVIIFEDFVRDPVTHFRRLLEFLEVDTSYQPESFSAYNRSHAPRFRFIRTVTNARIPQWLVWRLLPAVAGDRVTRGIVRSFRNSPLNRKSAPRAQLRPELRRRLEEEFEADVARLSEVLGRDMAAFWWKREAVSPGSV